MHQYRNFQVKSCLDTLRDNFVDTVRTSVEQVTGNTRIPIYDEMVFINSALSHVRYFLSWNLRDGLSRKYGEL